MVDNQRSCGAKIAGFDLKPDRCVILRHNDSYHYLTEDRDPVPFTIAPVLAQSDIEKPFDVFYDAACIGLWCVLMQEG